MLTLRVLGTLDLLGENGQDLPAVLAQPKRAALLAYLCVRAPAGFCRRDTLLALFWPEADTEHARAALRGALHFLRRNLGDDVIRTRGDDVGVDPERLTCDATLFERAVAEGRLDDALNLYGGDLLEGVHVSDAVEFQQWRDDERARLHRAAIEAAKALGARRESEGDRASAIHAAQRAVAFAPDDEMLAQRLMRLLDQAGDRAGALRAYDDLTARLNSTYESEPSPETRALIDAIRRRDRVTPSVVTTGQSEASNEREPIEVGAAASETHLDTRQRPDRSRLFMVIGAAGAAALLFAAVSSFRARAGNTAAPDSPDVVAVLPFTYEGARTTSYVGDGMERLLTTNLNGAGTLRVIDPVAVERVLAGETHGATTPGIDSVQARHIADRFGAGLIVTGQVSEAAGRLRVTADVISRGHSASQIVVDGTTDRLFDLVDELTTRLVAAWGAEKGQRLTSLAARTTHSLPALRAYLDGEREFSAGRYVSAVDAYQRAVSADSTFALAYYRLSSAVSWTSVPYTQSATRLARRFVGRLSRRDAMLVEARYANSEGHPVEAEQLYHALLADYPDEIEAWYQLGEVQYHWAGTLGRSALLSEPAFEHALALDPVHVPVLLHLARLAAATRRYGRLDSLRARLAALPMDPAASLEINALRSFTGDSSAGRAQAAARLTALGDARVRRLLPTLAAASEDLGAALGIARSIDPHGSVFEAELEVARGRWRAANAVLDRVAQDSQSVATEYRAAFAAATMFPVSRGELEKIRAAVEREPVAAGNAALVLYVDPASGIYAAQRAYLLSRLSARAGDSAAALPSLAEVRASGPLAYPLMPSFRVADDRFLRAELLHKAGRNDEALALYASFPDPGGYDLVYLAPAHLRQAEILDARGNQVAARAHYQRVVALWADCDPELRPIVDAARRRLAALGTRAGT